MTAPETTYQAVRLESLRERVIQAARKWAAADTAYDELPDEDRDDRSVAYCKALGTLAARETWLRGAIRALDLALAENPESVP